MQIRPFCIHTRQIQRYFSPEIEVMGISTEGMVCTSIVTDSLVIDYNNPFPTTEVDW